MRRQNNLVTLFTAITAFFFGSFITKILNSVDKCPANRSGSKLEPHPDIFLVVLILSAPSNVEHRDAMRETWLRLGQPLQLPYYPEEQVYMPAYDQRGGHLQMEMVTQQATRLREFINWQEKLLQHPPPVTQRKIRVKHLFAIGTQQMPSNLRDQIQSEQKQHKDLLLLPHLHESYRNLTGKLLQAIEGVIQQYDFSYLIKVDDDTYVKLDQLLNELVSYDRKLLRKTMDYGGEPLPQLYWGYFNGRANIKTKGQWKEPNYVLGKNYITYALGGGYVLSRKLCEHVVNNSHLLSHYTSEDVSMGTWLAPLRNVYRWHDPRFDTAYMARKCQSYHLVLHKRTPQMMRALYGGNLCAPEKNIMGANRLLEYYYDWTRTSDKCCDSLVV